MHGQSVLTQTMKIGDSFSTIMIPAAGRPSWRRAFIAVGGSWGQGRMRFPGMARSCHAPSRGPRRRDRRPKLHCAQVSTEHFFPARCPSRVGMHPFIRTIAQQPWKADPRSFSRLFLTVEQSQPPASLTRNPASGSPPRPAIWRHRTTRTNNHQTSSAGPAQAPAGCRGHDLRRQKQCGTRRTGYQSRLSRTQRILVFPA